MICVLHIILVWITMERMKKVKNIKNKETKINLLTLGQWSGEINCGKLMRIIIMRKKLTNGSSLSITCLQ